MELSKSEQLVLKYLIRRPNQSLYESEIAKSVSISTGSANQSLKSLLKKDIVKLEKKGNMNFYMLNLDNPFVRQYKITQTIAKLNGLINKLKHLTKRIILFGSCAEGTDMQDSDIDLAIVSSNKKEVRKILKDNESDRKIQPLIIDSGEFFSLEDKEKSLYERIQKGISLWRAD